MYESDLPGCKLELGSLEAEHMLPGLPDWPGWPREGIIIVEELGDCAYRCAELPACKAWTLNIE